MKKLVTDLSEDLLARSTATAEVDTGLREAYTQIEKGGRTADAFEVWREDYLDQVAVAWVLGCVFVRFMEDNHLIDECWLAGEGDRRKQAEDSHELYFREHPRESDREYFEHVFHEVGKIPACQDLFAEGKTPLWAVGPSGDAAMKLLAFWREIDTDSGQLKRTFDVEEGDTRFLGDLYQDLSERARKKYALLQTPVFVEEFILDRTLTPAINEFGLDELRMIDPTCGSGHFLLGGFARLFDLWIKREDNEIVAAQKALDRVWGVDVNPFAVAIARFRLIIAALRACGIKRLKDAPAWNIHLATGDSLLFGSRWDREGKKKGEQQFLGTAEESWAPEIYACEDKEAILEVLGQQYHAVVGNPPYITVKDAHLNQAYRHKYASCHRKYSIAVPFTERFFDLCFCRSQGSSGHVGLITTNSFMKREFGTKLIEEFFPKVDLTHVLDTSGAYIPGHGTPTVILLGRNRPPQSDNVRAVLGITGEPSTPDDPANGLVWQSIQRSIDVAPSQDDYTSSSDVVRSIFTKHPWSMGGGGASQLFETINSNAAGTLDKCLDVSGVFGMTNADEMFLADRRTFHRSKVENDLVRQLILGDEIRDWRINGHTHSIFPYAADGSLITPEKAPGMHRWLWPAKATLGNRATFGKGTYFSEGLPWWKWHQISFDRLKPSFTIMMPNIATHNHFALDRNNRASNVTAVIVQLTPEHDERDYLGVYGLLNSSAACFGSSKLLTTRGALLINICPPKNSTVRGFLPSKWNEVKAVSGNELFSRFTGDFFGHARQ
ncbi:MAG: BREX-2 system adenine-specific DNA-methyltransferase PglX [Planctomycetaceae bacterium]